MKKLNKKQNEEIFSEDLVKEVRDDFLRRQEERRSLEQQWKLNLNYLMGNQYCEITYQGDVSEEEKSYFWQDRNVYNHIAPIIETRIAKLARVRPLMSVRASGSEDSDVKCAKIAADVLNSTSQRVKLDGVISKATLFSEVLGTGFYKVLWSADQGEVVGESEGKKIYSGDVSVTAVSPFEIYPDSLFHESIDDIRSLIHARAMHVDDVEDVFGVKVEGEDINVFTLQKADSGYLSQNKLASGVVHDNTIVIERYERPSKKYPSGRVITVAGDKLISVCDLPFLNGVDGKRQIPFVKQECIAQPSCFFGVGVIDRLIPLQRAYNAVKNRKHEFMNRISMGVITVEDGSVDADELIEDGLSPGKVIVYRQGSKAPQFMSSNSVPIDFTYEEERLSNEFITISGVSEISRNSGLPTTATSGVALQILLDQDETRLSASAESIKRAIKLIAKQIIRLYKQFAKQTRMMKIAGESQKAELFYFNASDLTSDDVVFDTENELTSSPAQRKANVLEILQTGLLHDANGKMDDYTKSKVLDMMGFAGLENANQITQLHTSRANQENLEIQKGEIECDEFDDHSIHLIEHTRYLFSGELNSHKNVKEIKERLKQHMRVHKKLKEADNRVIGQDIAQGIE